jgi:hypothetical protein
MAVSEFWDAWPATPASLFASEAMVNQMGKQGKVNTVVNAQGLNLACYFWPATTPEPKAVAQLCHGNGAYLMEFLRTQVSSANCCFDFDHGVLSSLHIPGCVRSSTAEVPKSMLHTICKCRGLQNRLSTRARGSSA